MECGAGEKAISWKQVTSKSRLICEVLSISVTKALFYVRLTVRKSSDCLNLCLLRWARRRFFKAIWNEIRAGCLSKRARVMVKAKSFQGLSQLRDQTLADDTVSHVTFIGTSLLGYRFLWDSSLLTNLWIRRPCFHVYQYFTSILRGIFGHSSNFLIITFIFH